MARNISPDEVAADLEATFAMALTDALKSTDKPTAALLEVCRKAVDDNRAQKRWLTEQQALTSRGTAKATAPDTGEAPAPTQPRIVQGVDLDKLPFKVNRKGVEVPVKPDADEGNKPKTWDALTRPFMSPEN